MWKTCLSICKTYALALWDGDEKISRGELYGSKNRNGSIHRTEVYIEGINRTSNVVLPIKYGNFLDERLDECNLSLRAVKKEVFSPLTPVEVRVKIIEYFGDWNNNPHLTNKNEESVLHFVVANDSATEFRSGSGLYNHELYCIEVTKIAECVVVDALTYTNDIGRNYTENAALAEPVWE